MSHFAKIRPGGWPNGSTIDHAEIEQLDENLFKAIDGDTGGSWAPSTSIRAEARMTAVDAAQIERNGEALVERFAASFAELRALTEQFAAMALETDEILQQVLPEIGKRLKAPKLQTPTRDIAELIVLVEPTRDHLARRIAAAMPPATHGGN